MTHHPMKSIFRFSAILLVALAPVFASRVRAANEMTMTLNGEPAKPGDYARADVKELVLDNGLLKITFGPDARNQISATSLIKNGQELIHNLNGVQPRDTDAKRSFYHDWSASGGMMTVASVKIIKNTPDLVHFALIGAGTSPYLEDHYVMLKGESGIHPYVIIKGQFGGEMRTMYRFDMTLLDWTWANERVAQQRSYAYLQSISTAGNVGDETWRLPDGTIYSKYDYVLYYSESPMWGHFGHGFGAFFMPVSTESYAGGPLRQELAVHQDALILNYIGGGHFSGGGSAGGRTGEKIHGPWFVYINAGPDTNAIIADALKVAAEQEKQWPYQWMDESLYPVKRTAVTGQLKISHDRSAANAYVILAQPGNPARGGGRGGRGGAAPAATPPAGAATTVLNPVIASTGSGSGVFGQAAAAPPEIAPTDAASARGGRGRGGANNGAATDRASVIYTQSGDYIYSVKADANGKFTLPYVRPGTYTLYAWQTQGPITQSLAKDNVVVSGDSLDLGAVDWDPPYHPNLLWQIGNADRLAGEFKFGDQPRTSQWMLQVPADLTFTIGQSKEIKDWYYAQKSGTWTVKFNLAKIPSGNAYLTIAIAGGGGSVTASVNGTEVGNLSYGDDASVRRATNRSGAYKRNEFTFPASALKPGENILTLRANGAGLMYDTIVLESD
jgi:Polysaccharide lyase family 4, domain III/Polysaccharide lyase family 4, domain II